MSRISERTSLSLPLVGSLALVVFGGGAWMTSVNRDIQDLKNSMARVELKLGTAPKKEVAHEPAQIGPQKERLVPARDWNPLAPVWAGPR